MAIVYPRLFVVLSGDVKPPGIGVGDVCLEQDTGKRFVWGNGTDALGNATVTWLFQAVIPAPIADAADSGNVLLTEILGVLSEIRGLCQEAFS